ncbi:MAG: acetolactate synthase small subunit [Candidatus Dormibacteraeota bacterium]|nr:acetolactate synthase small subunit [Candidatus Dormibacteraeota bacterium]
MSTPDQNGATPPQRLRVLSAVVENQPGVLFRVSGMIRRRGFNIQGLSVGPTDDPRQSRMTLTVDAGHAAVDQVEKQLDRLIEVIAIEDLTDRPKLVRELALAKVAVTGPRRERVVAEVERVGGRVVDEGPEHVIFELSGEFEAVEGFLEALRPLGLSELARSGPVAMSRTTATT